MLDGLLYTLSNDNQLHLAASSTREILTHAPAKTQSDWWLWSTQLNKKHQNVRDELSLSAADTVRGQLKCWHMYCSTNTGWRQQCLYTVQKTCEGHLKCCKNDSEFNSKLWKNVCVCMQVCACVHVPVGAGRATPPCLMSLWRQSHVCRALNADRMEQVFI